MRAVKYAKRGFILKAVTNQIIGCRLRAPDDSLYDDEDNNKNISARVRARL
jgi:hypothetical protein